MRADDITSQIAQVAVQGHWASLKFFSRRTGVMKAGFNKSVPY
jgi:hypothetical protein